MSARLKKISFVSCWKMSSPSHSTKRSSTDSAVRWISTESVSSTVSTTAIVSKSPCAAFFKRSRQTFPSNQQSPYQLYVQRIHKVSCNSPSSLSLLFTSQHDTLKIRSCQFSKSSCRSDLPVATFPKTRAQSNTDSCRRELRFPTPVGENSDSRLL